MTTTYQKFLKKDIDLSPVGVAADGENAAYFCTPKGAKIIGWAGVDGIHYCFIRGFGEMVFAVSPMNLPGEYVHPLAECFADFLRLLLACGDAAALEQVWQWEKSQFDAFRRDNPVTAEQQRVLNVLGEKMELAPMAEPFSYIKSLQARFDDSKIKYTEDLCNPDMNANAQEKLPEWKVYFDGSFWGRSGGGRAGKEIPVGREFLWGESRWLVPAVYACGKGLVMDFCRQVPAGEIRAFLDRWDLSPETDDSGRFTWEQRMRMDKENPLVFDFHLEAAVNGRILKNEHGCSLCWIPCLSEEYAQEPEVRAAMAHYSLDPESGWVISRHCFSWATIRRPEMKSLSVILRQDPVSVPGPRFQVAAPGDCVQFVHPTTGLTHRLTVVEYERQELNADHFAQPGMEYPTHFIAMSCAITPELPQGVLTIRDCMESDAPRPKPGDARHPEFVGAACIGIIGGADGPTAIILGNSSKGTLQAACSAPRFAPPEEVEWRMIFHEKHLADITLQLL